MIPTLKEARKILNDKTPTRKIPYRNGFFYTSLLGYVCYHNGNPRTIGHAICTVKQFENPSHEDPVYTAARVVIATMHQWGQPTAASLYDLEQALNNADH